MFHLKNVGVGLAPTRLNVGLALTQLKVRIGLALTQLQEGYIWKPAGLSNYQHC